MFAVWCFLFGWRPGLVFSAGDGLDYAYPAVHFLRQHLGRDILYDPSWLGGAKVSNVWLSPWFLTVLLWLKFSSASALFFTLVIPQALAGFSGLQLFKSITARKQLPIAQRIFLLLLFSFPPWLAWKIYAGHFYYPSLLALAACALLAGLARAELSVFAAAVLAITVAATGESASYQQIISALYVALPLCVFIACKVRPGRAAWFVFTGVGAAAVFWNLRGQCEMLLHFLGADSSRSQRGAEIVYAFATSGWRDWLASLFWRPEIFSPGRSFSELLETNFPSGPILLLIAAGAIRGAWAGLMRIFLVLLLLLAMFASNFHPLSDLLLVVLYPLQYFRVPMRTLVPLLFCAAPLAYAFPGGGTSPTVKLRWRTLVAAALLVAAFILPPFRQEVLSWSLTLALLSSRLLALVGVETLLAPLALASILAFGSRLPPPMNLRETEANIEAMSKKILAASPELADPLVRASLDFQDEKFHANTAHLLGISSLDGYWQPLQSFNVVTSRAYGVNPNPFALNFRIPNTDPGSADLYRLYNVKFRLHLEANGILKSVPIQGGGSRGWLLHQKEEEPCASGHVDSVKILDPFFRAEVALSKNSGACRLVMPMNFALNLRALGASNEVLSVTKAEGGLFAVLVPGGTTSVVVEAIPLLPAWFWIFRYLACALITLSLAFWHRTLARAG